MITEAPKEKQKELERVLFHEDKDTEGNNNEGKAEK